MMMGVPIDDIARLVIEEGRFFEGVFGKGLVITGYSAVLNSEDQIINGFE